jgi:hypothetical protein
MLAAAHGTLSERHPVARDVFNLSALMGARPGTAGDTLTTKEREGEWSFLETKGGRGGCYLPQTGEASLPLPRGLGRHLHRTHWHLCDARRHLHRRPGGGRLHARLGGQLYGRPLSPWGWGHGFPPARGGPLLVALLLVRLWVCQHRWRGEPLLLAQPVLLVVLLKALLPPDLSLLCEGRPLPLPLPLLRGSAGGRRSGRRRV